MATSRRSVALNYFQTGLRILFTTFLETKTQLCKLMWAFLGSFGSSGSPLYPPLASIGFLLPPKYSCTPLFYGLPKIHKPQYLLHLIVSEYDGPTDRFSAYITHFIQPLARNLPSQIKDTKHFINLIEKTSTPPIQCTLGRSWRNVLIHKHPTQGRLSSLDPLHGKIHASSTQKLPTSPYSACHPRFDPQTHHLQVHERTFTPNPWHLHGH